MTPKYILPTPEDNIAIVPEQLEPGESFEIEGVTVTLPHVILQGHRICARSVAQGEPLLSWGMPFGTALVDIAPGEYICNQKMKDVLLHRNADDFPLGSEPVVNFEDRDTIRERTLPTAPVYGPNEPTRADALTFPGYFRGESRGWGTRNFLAVIGTTSHSRSVVIAAAEELARKYPATEGFDGVVPVVHTEGGGRTTPNNEHLLVRTLAGFAVNPNVGAAIIVGDPAAPISNRQVLRELGMLPHSPSEYTVRFCQESDASAEAVDRVVATADSVAGKVIGLNRTPAPLSALKVGMQCGGSDAFSGVSANQVLGRAMDTLIDHGGTVGIAETDELIGSEVYTLARLKDESISAGFLSIQQRFKDYAGKHGHTAEGNVSGGNIYRGLYNITLKSLGAARKKDPHTAIDHVIDYGQPMSEPGFYFMDSPGNDLESIAGQVASGANLIIFTTGNGSITNFPFVPTIKVVTTTSRFEHLASDMDYNAGRILDGHSMDEEGQELFDLALSTASGARTKGEGTGQSQTQIWRNWPIVLEGDASEDPLAVDCSGEPLLPLGSIDDSRLPDAVTRWRAPDLVASRFDLILPTSLCSGQVGEKIAAADPGGLTEAGARAIALSHTEGCGVSSGNSEEIFRDIMVGYAAHPLVAHTVFLEHGCEKTHNDYFRQAVSQRGLDVNNFDWASIQAEGGIAKVSEHVNAALSEARRRRGEGGSVPDRSGSDSAIGISTSAHNAESVARTAARLVLSALFAGVSVIIAADDPVLTESGFRAEIAAAVDADATTGTEWSADARLLPTLSHAGVMAAPGLHIMDNASADWLETATGLGASGASVLVVFADEHPRQPHRFLPTIQVGVAGQEKGMDLVFDTGAGEADEGRGQTDRILALVSDALLNRFSQATAARPNVGFQVSRGHSGISL